MSGIAVTYSDFVFEFPEFANTSESLFNQFLIQAKCYISDEDYGVLHGEARRLAIELMTAHLLTLNSRLTEDNQSQATVVASANIGGVSVSLVPPASANQYEFWLNLTIYGTRLWALLSAKTACGFYVEGSPQRVL